MKYLFKIIFSMFEILIVLIFLILGQMLFFIWHFRLSNSLTEYCVDWIKDIKSESVYYFKNGKTNPSLDLDSEDEAFYRDYWNL